MGESQSGGRDSRQTEFDNGGWVEEFFGGNDSSAFTYSPPSTPSYGMSPGAMGGRQPNTVPDVQPSRYGRSFDPGVYSEPETSIVPSFDGPMGSGASTNAAVRDLQRFGSGIAALTGGSRPDQTSSPSYTPSSSTSGTMPTVQGPAPSVMGFEPSGGTGVTAQDVYSRRARDASERMFAEPAYVSLYNNPDPMILLQDSVPFYDDMGGRRFIPPGSDTGFPPDAPAYDPTDATDAALRRSVSALNASYDRAPYPVGGGTSRPDPALFPQELGGGTIDSPPILSTESPYDINNLEAGRPADPSEQQKVKSLYGRGFTPSLFPEELGDNLSSSSSLLTPMATTELYPEELGDNVYKKYSDLASGKTKPKTTEDLNWLQRFGRWLQGKGKAISDFGMDDLKAFFTQGGPGGGAKLIPFMQYTPPGFSPMGPGPAVGGGVPSPSGVGGAPSPIQCPPGFKFDPVQNVCVPIVAPKPPVATPPVATPPKTTAATGGISNIPNVYPFTLTPPIGAPIGNIAPVRS